MGFAFRSGDVAYYQGPRPDLSGMQTVFVCTARCNLGGFQVTTYANEQTAWAKQQLGHSSFYLFNGNVDPFSAGVLFAQQALMNFDVGVSGILIDNEDEGSTGTASWGPVQDIDFVNGVRAVRADIPVSAFICYMNKSTNTRFNWSACVNSGMGLMYARPDGPDDYLWWPKPYDRYMKQDGTVNGIDADWHNTPWSTIIGASASALPEGDEDMTFHVLRQSNGHTFVLQKDLIIFDPSDSDQWIGNYLRGGQKPFGLNESDLLIALYRAAGISQTLAPWPSGDKTATNILDSVLPGPGAQFTRQVFDAAGTPSLIKYN